MLHHIPHRYLDFSRNIPIARAQIGEVVTIKGELLSLKNQYTKSAKKIQIGEITDSSGKITVAWFNQPFLTRTLYPGEMVALAGKVDWFGRKKALIAPEYEKLKPGTEPIHTGKLIPIYPETSGISSKWLRNRIKYVFPEIQTELQEYLPEDILEKLDLENFDQSLASVHFPQNERDIERGKKRLAFNELLLMQLISRERKLNWEENHSVYDLKIDKKLVEEFINSLVFKLTKSQLNAVDEISKDLVKASPMNRLLEGDVGSGKTVVAAFSAFIAFANGYQTVIMAPTQILAQQHYETLSRLFEPFKARIGLVTSAETKLDVGRIDLFIGTHALIHQKIPFDKVALAVIDEQHRFGVEQRAHLTKIVGKKRFAPHVLTMTATPIPRTIALSLYGDLDLSTLDELPPGRIPVTTWVVPPVKRGGAYKWIREQIAKNKTQVFVVCPLIEESDKETMLNVKSATKEFENLKSIFPELKLGLIHGRLKAAEKNKVLNEFKKGEIDILVSTPVIEVGIDVPNASVMLIEGAERFGLAQLHQLRGRVGRGNQKSYCLLFTESKSVEALTRLSAMEKQASGFELAELDLRLRGPGKYSGLDSTVFLNSRLLLGATSS